MYNSDLLEIIPLACMYYNGYNLKINGPFRPVKMTHFELDIITSGRAHLKIDDTTYHFYPEEICFRKPGQRNEHLIDTPYECMHIRFNVVNDSTAENFFDKIPTFISRQDSREIRDIVFNFHKYYCYQSDYNNMMCDAMLTTLKAALFKFVHKIDTDKPIIYHTTIQKAIDSMSKNIESQLTVEELAEYCGYSTNYFQVIFKKATGITPHQYLLNMRIDEAKGLLRSSSLSIGDISLRCGFSDSNYFSEVFKQKTGITPRQFRQQNT